MAATIFPEWKIFKDFLGRHSCGLQIKHIDNTYAHSANAGPSPALPRIHCDSLCQCGCHTCYLDATIIDARIAPMGAQLQPPTASIRRGHGRSARNAPETLGHEPSPACHVGGPPFSYSTSLGSSTKSMPSKISLTRLDDNLPMCSSS